MGKYILEVKNLNKYFGQNQVLKQVNLCLKPGEIYGLIGANGSGKSTLMNILFGNSAIEETGGYDGEVWYKGEKVRISSTKDAISRGIGMIHQEFVLIPEMTVAENIKLTRENTKKYFSRVLKPEISYIDKKKNQEDTKNVLEELGFHIDNSYLVKNISVNAKQFVEIAREVDKKDIKLLLLDEPTAVLNAEDAKKLMKVLKSMAEKGTTILFCSHRLHEICEICDRVTVIRDGEVVSEYDKREFDAELLAKDMMGYDVSTVKKEKKILNKESIISFSNFSVHMPGESLKKITLDVHKGEILGITSLSGHGKLALGYGIMGVFPVEGDVLLEGKKLDVGNVKKTIEQGIFLLPDDRKNMGLLLEHSICENIIFSGFYGKNMFEKRMFGVFPVRDWKQIKSYAEEQIKRFDIKCESMEQNTGELSGGNQQKVCIARALAVNPKVLVIMEPTRGVDIGAKEKILDMLVKMNQEKGMTILVASSELDELKRISDRIAVFCEGKLSNILPPEASEEEFAFAYTGEEVKNEK